MDILTLENKEEMMKMSVILMALGLGGKSITVISQHMGNLFVDSLSRQL